MAINLKRCCFTSQKLVYLPQMVFVNGFNCKNPLRSAKRPSHVKQHCYGSAAATMSEVIAPLSFLSSRIRLLTESISSLIRAADRIALTTVHKGKLDQMLNISGETKQLASKVSKDEAITGRN